jgi:hypothetical protein
MFHFPNRLTHRSVRGVQTAISLVLAIGAAACDENSITNNYFNLQPTAPDAGGDAGDAGQTTVTVAESSSTATTETLVSVDASAASTDTPEESTSAPVVSSTSPEASVSETLETLVSIDAGSGIDADVPPALPLEDGAPVVNSTPADLEIDLFGTFNNKYWFVVTQEQVDRMNQRDDGGGGCPGCYGDIYAPNSPIDSSNKTHAEHMLVTNDQGQTADFGKVQTKVKGESTFRPWTETTLPNIRVDMDDFVKGQSLDGFEHLRFNNALVGSIFREKFTFDYYREMGYPAPYSSYGWVSNSIWGEGVEVPYVVSEVYKRSFCNKRLDYFGGECPNMWEFYGDVGGSRGYYPWYAPYQGGGLFDNPTNCQFDTCDSTRANDFEAAIAATPQGPGFKEALSEYLDWDAYHDFQCLSWIFVTGDDTFHNNNNNVIVERADGKFQWLPYSIDISFGQDWYPYEPLPGDNTLARGCQSDPDCWADVIAACDVMLDKYVASDPVARLDALYNELDEAGMLRNGDDGRYQFMRGYIEERLVDMPGELDLNRDAPYYGPVDCGYPYVACGQYCELPQNCKDCGEYYVGGQGYYGYYGYPVPPMIDPPVAVPGAAVGIAIAPVPNDPIPVPTGPVPPPFTENPPPVVDGGVVTPDVDGGVEIPPLCRPYVGYEGGK